MNAAEFAAIRISNGLSIVDLAEILGVNERNVRRWEAGHLSVSDRIAAEMERFDQSTDDLVAELVEKSPSHIVIDEDFDVDYWGMPERWRLVVAHRVKKALPDTRIVFSEQQAMS